MRAIFFSDSLCGQIIKIPTSSSQGAIGASPSSLLSPISLILRFFFNNNNYYNNSIRYYRLNFRFFFSFDLHDASCDSCPIGIWNYFIVSFVWYFLIYDSVLSDCCLRFNSVFFPSRCSLKRLYHTPV